MAKVEAKLWSNVHEPGFDGLRLKCVTPWDVRSQQVDGNTIVAADLVGCDIDDLVMVIYEGSSSRLALNNAKTSCEAIIVGILDEVCWNERTAHREGV